MSGIGSYYKYYNVKFEYIISILIHIYVCYMYAYKRFEYIP